MTYSVSGTVVGRGMLCDQDRRVPPLLELPGGSGTEGKRMQCQRRMNTMQEKQSERTAREWVQRMWGAQGPLSEGLLTETGPTERRSHG